MSSKAKDNKRPFVFLGVGLFNTVLDFAFYTFLTSTVFKNGENIALAGFLSGTFALLIAFATHGLITWRGANLTRRVLAKFALFTGFGMWVIRPLLLSFFIHFSSFYSWLQSLLDSLGIDVSYNFVANTCAFGFMLIFVLSYNYYVYSHYVFNDTTHTDPGSH